MEQKRGGGQTLAQKILSRAAGRERVEPGEYINVSPDYTCCQEIYWPIHKRHMAEIGVDRVARPDTVVMVVDHTTSAAMGSPYHKVHQEVAEFARRNGIENFFGPGSGLRHMVLAERGFARPGILVFSDEPNIASIGVFGALNMPISWEVVVTLIGEENWVAVPKSARIEIEGTLPFGVTARDLAQVINRDFGDTDRLLQCCVEYGGAIEALSLDERQTLLACAFHAGADTAIMQVDDRARRYVEERAQGRPTFLFNADPDAQYSLHAGYALDKLSPMVTVPPKIHSAVPVADVEGTRIDQAAVGSCAGNRLDDLRAAAAVLKGRKVARHVTFYISPGSREIYAAAAREGLLEIFMAAGATVLAPGCNTCWGYLGVLGDDQVSITTHQFNYQGRNGSRSARVHLAGPFAVAASAVAGCITDPRPMLADSRQTAS